MVFTSRIEVFGVKPDLYFSFVINSFHKDLFSQGDLLFPKKDIPLFSEEPADDNRGIPGRGLFFPGMTCTL